MTNLLTHITNTATMLLVKLGAIFKTGYGWMCAAWIFVINFFVGYEKAVCAVAVCVALDTIWGIVAQIKQKKFARSKLGRNGMLSKWFLYASVIIAFIHIESMAGIDSHLTVIVVCSLICLVEIWSMSGSALIINPNMPFLRLFRSVLTGEIADKMRTTPDKVEEYFKQADENNQ